MKSTWQYHVDQPQRPFPGQGDLKHTAFQLLSLWGVVCLLFCFVLNVGLFGHTF